MYYVARNTGVKWLGGKEISRKRALIYGARVCIPLFQKGLDSLIRRTTPNDGGVDKFSSLDSVNSVVLRKKRNEKN